MSTLQHTPQTAVRSRLWMVVAVLGAAALLTVALVVLRSDSSTPRSAAISVPSSPSGNWLENITAARSAIAHGEPAPVKSDVAAQRNTLAATSGAIAGHTSAQTPQSEPEALIDARFRHPVPTGQR
jgi:hypothetical protein